MTPTNLTPEALPAMPASTWQIARAFHDEPAYRAEEMRAYGLSCFQAGAAAERAKPKPIIAWVTPMAYGSQVTFYKPPKPEGWDNSDRGDEWYCKPLCYVDAPTPTAPRAETPADAAVLLGMELKEWIATEFGITGGTLHAKINKLVDLATHPNPPAETPADMAAIQIRQADSRGDEALARAHKLEEALEYLFLAIVTRADSDYLYRAVKRADEALRTSMPGWTPPVPMTGWLATHPNPPKPDTAAPAQPCQRCKGVIGDCTGDDCDGTGEYQAHWIESADTAATRGDEPTAWEIVRAAEDVGMDGLTDPYLSDGDRQINGAGLQFVKAVRQVLAWYVRSYKGAK